MNFIRRFLAKRRIRRARRQLAASPSPQNYLLLAREFADLGYFREVVRTCEEGLLAFHRHPDLGRMRERAIRAMRESLIGQLRAELAEAPRPALWHELCEILLQSGKLAKAQECADGWRAQFPNDPEAFLTLARIRTERYYSDRARDDGRLAVEALDDAIAALHGDPRPLRAKLDLLYRIGAWTEARQCAGYLLQLEPGDPALEARFRLLDSQVDPTWTLDRALIEVERTGLFADEQHAEHNPEAKTDVRPILRSLAEEPDVQAAMYVRGQTALVQGARGATAERMARSIREIIGSGRAAARRLGLGQVMQVQLEGDFGALQIAPGERDAGALWSLGRSSRSRERIVLGLAGANACVESEVEA